MKETTKKDIQENLEEIIAAFNKTLSEKGFDNVRIQNFRLLEDETPAACIEWRWIRRSNGTYYRRCVRWS